MKFELNDYHRNVSDEELLHDLQRVAAIFSINTLTIEQYSTYGKYNHSTIRRRFGSWKKALILAQLDSARKNEKCSNDEYIQDIRRVAEVLGKKTITSTEYAEYGTHSRNRVLNRFGSWEKALHEAGLLPTGYMFRLIVIPRFLKKSSAFGYCLDDNLRRQIFEQAFHISPSTVIYDILVAGEVHFNLLLNGSIAIIRALMVLKKYIIMSP